MEKTIVQYLLDLIEVRLMLNNKKIIYNIDSDYFLKKEQEQKDNFALEFIEWYKYANNNEYCLYPKANLQEHLKIFKKEKGYFN
jgi:hypothetical protein